MKEKQLNYILTKSLKNVGFAFKIPDASLDAMSTVQRPFDIFCVNSYFIAYIESKLLKGYKSFNFKLIKPHQFFNLMQIKCIALANYAKCYFEGDDNILSLIVVGIWESRKYFDVYFFDIGLIEKLKTQGKKSILKKEFLKLREQGMYLPIKSELIEVRKIGEKIISSL